jgi:hypothetical protein
MAVRMFGREKKYSSIRSEIKSYHRTKFLREYKAEHEGPHEDSEIIELCSNTMSPRGCEIRFKDIKAAVN